VHAHSHLFFSTNLAALKRKMSSTPLVITNHGFRVQRGPWMDLLQDAYLATAGGWTLRAADKVISLENDEARRVCSLGVHPSKSIVIPNGVDIDVFRPTHVSAAGNSILWAGRFVEEKGVKYLLDAVSLISKKMPSIRLSLVGYGPLEDRLKSYAQHLDISRNVVFQGPVDHRTLASLMNECALLALPNLRAELSSVMLEAMACARPFVATDGTALIDAVGGAGVFVPARDSESLAEAILHLLSDEALRRKLGHRARSIAIQKYSWRTVAEAHTDLFQRLIGA
jgi:glycosyltransferase involved in cell wall biosynthesis